MKKKILSVSLLLCMVVSLSTTAMAAGFTDVKSDAYYAKPVAWAVEKGVTAGTGDGTTFSPSNTCTRAQILTFLWRAAGSPKTDLFLMNPYLDISEDAYYYEAALWAKECGMVQGSEFKPNIPCTRAAAVEYIWRYARCPEAAAVSFKDVSAGTDSAKAISWAVGYGVTNGVTATTFEPGKTCTRGQIVTFLHRYFVEPLETTPAPAPAPAPAGGDMKLDPLPPMDYMKQPDWYGTLTPAHTMSNARLIAELRQIDKVIDERMAQDIYMSDGPYSRQLDLWSQASQRYDIVKRYDRGIDDTISGLSDRARNAYNELIAAHGDADPLRDYFN